MKPKPENIDPLQSPWLVRLFCTSCGDEHYRYFNQSQTSPVCKTEGQCRRCFDEIEATMQLMNMIPQRIGQLSWHECPSSSTTFRQSPGWTERRNNTRATVSFIRRLNS